MWDKSHYTPPVGAAKLRAAPAVEADLPATITVTTAMLRAWDACQEGIDDFLVAFPSGEGEYQAVLDRERQFWIPRPRAPMSRADTAGDNTWPAFPPRSRIS